MQQVRAKKSLGQHFLIDLDVAQRIAATIEDTVYHDGVHISVVQQTLYTR